MISITRTAIQATKRLSTLRPLTTTTITTKQHQFSRTFTSTTAKMSAPSANLILDAVKARRTYYPLSKTLPIETARVDDIVKTALAHVPSSFNSQSNRVVVLHGAEHEKFWDIALSVLKAIVPAEQWESTSGKLNMFKGAAGSVLFFEDQDVVNGMQEKFALYADRFPVWANQSDGMLQFAVWTALEAEGLGANLQHYNPLVDQQVAAEWKVPASWKLNAQLVFGGRTGEAGPKEFKPIEDIFKTFSS
ncbi:nitroreductase [Colletotrichum abscissum]|uniref:Nitroreductase n=1 Tax=Colletotrichum abscissum TaxID=1671311 RepID=A0A9P9X3U7_9PEZI|nr:nitroreductase [Colletotrichum abscissum]KAI3535083.1 nitroreductase [Colletotrichum abscissum]KAK1495554.1 nitroreductase [Colletotrichum abscissum]